jgi:transposase
MPERRTFLGLDVHNASVAIAVVEGGGGGEARRVGAVENRPAVLRHLSFCCPSGVDAC